MATRSDFWTNGIATILQSPERAKFLSHQTNLGTVVEQDPNTSSWFHIPLTTPTVLNGDYTVYLRKFALKAKVNENATIDTIHIRRGTHLVANIDTNFTNTSVSEVYDITDVIMSNAGQAGLAMSILVKFLTGTPRGRVEFQGAGAVYW